MKVTNGKACATLTEVKNKIGDVFALADEYGEITVTSYNKPKYTIARLSTKKRIEADPAPPKREEVVKPKLAELVRTPVDEIIGVFSAISDTELWQRDNKREQLWTKQVRNRL